MTRCPPIMRALVVASVATLAAACSLIIDVGDECANNAGCAPGEQCAGGLCVAPEASGGPGAGADAAGFSSDGGGLESDASAEADASGAGGPEDATHETDVAAPADVAASDTAPPSDGGKEPEVLTPEELLKAPCDQLFGVAPEDALDEDTLLLGALVSRSGGLGQLGPFIDKALHLAVAEINQVGGIYGQKLAILSCDDGTQVQQAVDAAEHLVEVVQVPAILGALSSGVTIETFNQVARDAGVLMMSPAAVSPVLTTFPDDGLVWRTAPSVALQGVAIAQHLLAAHQTKIAVVNRDDAYGNGLAASIQSATCTGTDCTNEAFAAFIYADATLAEDQAKAIEGLRSFEPDVVVLISYPEDGIAFLNAAAAAGLTDFLLADGARDALLVEQVDSEALLCKALGTSFAAAQGPVYEAFRLRYKGKWGEEPVPYTANAYDAAYVLAYAMAASLGQDADVTGADLSDAVKRLTAGEVVEAGSMQWNKAYQLLQAGPNATIDFEGASGSLDFDPETGDVTAPVEAWHFDLSKGAPASLGIIYTESGEYQEPQGTLDDPDPVCAEALALSGEEDTR